jgi:hypothetical protein
MPPGLNGQKRKSRKTLVEVLRQALVEFLGAVLTILSMYLIRRLVQFLLGGEVLWGVVPIKYCEDTVDLAVFARFVWQVLRTFND